MPGTELELTVERLVNGPGALAHAPDGRVVFLDEGLPGERVRVAAVEERRDFVRARVVRALGPPAPGRRAPPCPVVALCGGCPWQKLTYAEQVREKEALVLREVERGAGARPDQVLPPVFGPELRFRHRIRLAVGRAENGSPVVGYRFRGSRGIVPIDDCPIARLEIAAALPLARRLAELESAVREVELSVDDRAGLRLRGVCRPERPRSAGAVWDPVRACAADLDLAGAGLVGLVLEARDRRGGWRSEAGDVLQRIEVQPGCVIGVPVGTFTQVNGSLNRELVSAVVEAAGARPERRIIDLYCGAGNFTLPLARAGAQVLGIDVDEHAVAAARDSAAALGLAARATFRAGAADDRALAGEVDVVVLDPPRAGAVAVLPAVLARRPERIVYVSCDVATFARDARQILAAGGRFASLRLVDLTPQTHRAEVLGVFQLTWERGGPYRDA